MSGTNGKAARPPLLDLDSTLAPAEYVALDGVRYPVTKLDAYGLRARSVFFALAQRISALEELAVQGQAGDDDEREYEQRVRELAGRIIPTAPAEKLDAVPFGQLVALGSAFFIYMTRVSPLPRALAQMVEQTTARPSPASRASTAAANGSSKPRSLSSRRSP